MTDHHFDNKDCTWERWVEKHERLLARAFVLVTITAFVYAIKEEQQNRKAEAQKRVKAQEANRGSVCTHCGIFRGFIGRWKWHLLS